MTSAKKPPTEIDFIQWIREHTPQLPENYVVGIGDDSAVVNTFGKTSVVITTDSVVEGVHFKPETEPYLAGRKAMARGLSDIAAMGVEPSFCVAAVCFGQNSSLRDAKAVYKGMRFIADKFNVKIIGGDVSNSGKNLFLINVTAIGLTRMKPVTRSGARDGDAILVTGALGGSILGRHLNFLPRIKEGLALNRKFKLHSMIDISDGLAADLGHILEESRCRGAVLYENAIPVSASAEKLARSTRRPVIEHCIYDGEDYELLFTASQQEARKILEWAKGRIKISVIGQIRNNKKGIFLGSGNRETELEKKGYRHTMRS
ncbi:MAG: thiamine-phosphate kinase [Planctomycetes bacterium]|nr:thiamine-phosphate kinase [Planctomycetota bacterium]